MKAIMMDIEDINTATLGIVFKSLKINIFLKIQKQDYVLLIKVRCEKYINISVFI